MKVECINDMALDKMHPSEYTKGGVYNVIDEGKCKCGLEYFTLDIKSQYTTAYVCSKCNQLIMHKGNVLAAKHRFVIIDKPAFKKITYTEVLQLVEVSEN